MPFAALRFLIVLTVCASLSAQLPSGCAGSSPVASFKLFVKPNGYAPFPLRDVNEIEKGMKIQYQPVRVYGDDPDDAKVTLILAESRRGAETERLLILDPQRADHVAEWEVPFRTSIVALVFGPQGLSEGKVTELIRKDTSLVKQLADYAEQNQKVEDLINVLAEAERNPRSGESVDAALAGFASRYGSSMTAIDRDAPTSEQAAALFRTLNPALTTYDPLAPDSSQRLQQSAGLAASVAGLFWGSQVALYAGGAGLFLNLRSLMFPGSEFRSALMQSEEEDRMLLCARNTERKSRTRLAYLWATRVPDSNAPGITIAERADAGAGLESAVPVRLSQPALWRHLHRAQDWKLVAADGKQVYDIRPTVDAAKGTLHFAVPATVEPGAYQLAARWDWEPLRANGIVHVHRVPSGENVRVAAASRAALLDNAERIEVGLEGADFRFVESATLVRKGDPYATPVSVPHRLSEPNADGRRTIRVLLEAPLRTGTYGLTLTQQGGSTIAVDLPVLPQPPVLSNLPVSLNLGAKEQTVRLRGERLELIDTLEADGVTWQRVTDPATPRGELHFAGTITDEIPEGARRDLRLRLNDRPDPVVVPAALNILGPLPVLVSSRLAHRDQNGVHLRENELALGGLATTLLEVRHATATPTLVLGCTEGRAQREELRLQTGDNGRSARLQVLRPDTFYLTFDPAMVGHHGCQVSARLATANGQSEALSLGRLVRLPKLESFSLTDEMAGENLFLGTLTGQDLEAIASVGWDPANPVPVTAIPRPLEGDSRKLELRVTLPWPAPTPRAPLYIWLRDEEQGRVTKTRLGS